MGAGYEAPVQRPGGVGHAGGGEIAVDGGAALFGETLPERGIVHEASEVCDEGFGVAGPVEQAAAGRLDQLGERPMGRLNDGDAGRQRFDRVQTLRFRVDGRHGEDVQTLQELPLLGAGYFTPIFEVQVFCAQFGADALQVWPVRAAEIARRTQPAVTTGAAQYAKGVSQLSEAFGSADAGEIADRKRPLRWAGGGGEVGSLNAERNAVDAVHGQAEMHGGVVCVVVRQRDEAVDPGRGGADHVEDLRAVRRRQAVEEDVLAREAAKQRHVQRRLQAPRQSDEHQVGEVNEIGPELAQTDHELLQLFALGAAFAGEDSGRQFPQLCRACAGGQAPDRAQQGRGVEEPIEQPRRVAEKRAGLLEIDVDAAVVDMRRAGVGLVGADGRVERDEDGVAALRAQRGGQPAIVQATAAVHARGPGGEMDDSHTGASRVAGRILTQNGPAVEDRRAVVIGGVESASVAADQDDEDDMSVATMNLRFGRQHGLGIAILLAIVCVSASGGQEATTRPASAPASAPSSAPATGTDWPMFRGNSANTGVAGTALPEKLHVRWKHELGAGTTSTAAIANGVVYVGDDDGKLYALELATGRLRWQYAAADAVQSSPTVVAGLVVCGDDAGVLQACDAQTGAARWTFKTDDRIISSAVPQGERLVVGSYDGGLYCLRIADGERVWRYDVQERVHATPAVVGEQVLVAACDGQLHIVNLADGTPVRRVQLGAVSGAAAAVSGAYVYLATYGQEVVGIDWRVGAVLWRFEDEERQLPYLSSAAVSGGLVIVGGQDKRVHALDTRNGAQRWRFVTRGRVDSSPVVAGERVYVGSADGNLYALDLRTGAEVWRFEAGGAIAASPAVGAGCLVVGTESGVLYCFAGGAAESENRRARD